MRAQAAAIQGGLAAVALAAAWVTWQRPPDQAQGDVVVLNLSKTDVDRVRYEDGTHWVELVPGKGEKGAPRVWVFQGNQPQAASPDAGVGGKPVQVATAGRDGGAAVRPVPQAPLVPDRQLRGNESAERTFALLAPLTASRLLGVLDQSKLKELGVAGSARRLKISYRDKSHGFVVAPSASGLGSSYLEDEEGGQVYVLGSELIRNLESASGLLIERRLHSFPTDEVQGLTVEAQGKVREFTMEGEAPQPRTLVAKGSKSPDGFAKNWSDKVLRLFPVEVLGRGELPPSGVPVIQFKVRYFSRGDNPLGFLEVGKAGMDFYGRSEFTAGWVKLPVGPEELVRESQKVVTP